MERSYLLLMRHGAGIKAGQDAAKIPAKDGILTDEGFRAAEAVGQRLAETLAAMQVRVASIRYAAAGTPDAPAGGPARRRVPHAPGADREPEATARVVARQLATVLAVGKAADWTLEPWPAIGTDRFPARREGAARNARSAADCLEDAAADGEAVLVVGNSPQIDWIAARLHGRPVPIDRGEVVCLERPRRRWGSPRRRRWDLSWTVAPDDAAAAGAIRDKIRSKMDTAKFLGTFITALVTFVLGKRFDAVKAAAEQSRAIPPVQGWLWLVTVVLLAVAALSCFTALFFYDTLLMPHRFWGSSAPRRGRPGWLAERPPSSTALVLQQNMMRIWSRLVVPAVWALGLALVSFALLVLVHPADADDLRHAVAPGPVLAALAAAVLVASYVRASRPRLGAQD